MAAWQIQASAIMAAWKMKSGSVKAGSLKAKYQRSTSTYGNISA